MSVLYIKNNNFKPDNPNYNCMSHLCFQYFSSDTGGLPATVQCVTLPYQEELCLHVMKQLELGLKQQYNLRNRNRWTGYKCDQPGYKCDQPGYKCDQPGYKCDQPGYKCDQNLFLNQVW